MSLKKEDSGLRWVQVEVEVPGTPEEVWQAIATGPGVSSWFVPTETREDGTIVSHFGPGMDAVARQTAWDPPHRFAAEGEMGPNAPKMATEWTVEARSGSVCVVRVVHSLFASTDDWDDQLENIEGGWPVYFQILRLYLSHFRGQPCSAFQLMGITTDSAASAWDVLTRSLDLTEAKLGEHRQTPADAPRLAGLVELTGQPGHPHQLLIRLDEPTTGIAHLFALSMGGLVFISIRIYLYGEAAPAAMANNEPSWTAWMNKHFPTNGVPSPSC
ncbi:SRPBCC domain-containing protein [Singulisphaera sp. Ch08]|uniref:SRPBCC domain-containing protein n=1 Tax=Singulisphaera sp. Ch08 TaxID=3120278 RepID=A0AAU7CBL2_9BACT